MSAQKIPVIERIMSANDDVALQNRALLDAHHVQAINVMASPGAGKKCAPDLLREITRP